MRILPGQDPYRHIRRQYNEPRDDGAVPVAAERSHRDPGTRWPLSTRTTDMSCSRVRRVLKAVCLLTALRDFRRRTVDQGRLAPKSQLMIEHLFCQLS